MSNGIISLAIHFFVLVTRFRNVIVTCITSVLKCHAWKYLETQYNMIDMYMCTCIYVPQGHDEEVEGDQRVLGLQYNRYANSHYEQRDIQLEVCLS